MMVCCPLLSCFCPKDNTQQQNLNAVSCRFRDGGLSPVAISNWWWMRTDVGFRNPALVTGCITWPPPSSSSLMLPQLCILPCRDLANHSSTCSMPMFFHNCERSVRSTNVFPGCRDVIDSTGVPLNTSPPYHHRLHRHSRMTHTHIIITLLSITLMLLFFLLL